MERNYRELQKYNVIESGGAYGVVVVDKDGEEFLICEYDNCGYAEQRAERLNYKIKARITAAGPSQSD